jgi:hypothetical protein
MFAVRASGAEKNPEKLDLAIQGKALYSIAFDEATASPSEKTAVKELLDYLGKISGAKFSVVPAKADGKNKKLVLGNNKLSRKFLGDKLINSLAKEEFIMRSDKSGNIYIVGGRQRGTLYGAYYLLDHILGVRWFTPDCENVPKRSELSVSPMNIRNKPVFVMREMHMRGGMTHPYYLDPVWCARNRLNRNMTDDDSKMPFPEEYGGREAYAPPNFCHTMHFLIPPAEYYKKHPEWWALFNGKRENRGMQSDMCLTNEGLIREVAANVSAILRKNPKTQIISVTENDNTLKACTCAKCQEVIKKYGESGLNINFVNKVAEIVSKEFPNVLIETFAYIRTQKPPKNLKLHPNVAIRLTVWVKNRSVPYNDPRNPNKDFVNVTVRSWARLTPNLGIWDYCENLSDHFMPHPDFHVLAANMEAFKNAGVKRMFIQGCPGKKNYGEGTVERSWIIARSMSNRNVDWKKELSDFVDAYYGKPAGKYIKEYWLMLHEVNRQAGYMKLTQGGSPGAPSLSLATMLKADKLFRKALDAAKGNPLHYKRVSLAYMPIQYMFMSNWNTWEQKMQAANKKMPGSFNEYYDNFVDKVKKNGIININEFRAKTLDYVKSLKVAADNGFIVSASKTYSGSLVPVYGGGGGKRTVWNAGGYTGWAQVEFMKPLTIENIYTNFGAIYGSMLYKIQGSMNGKTWFDLVKMRTTTTRDAQGLATDRFFFAKGELYAFDKLITPQKAKFVRTYLYKATTYKTKNRQWVCMKRQRFNVPQTK